MAIIKLELKHESDGHKISTFLDTDHIASIYVHETDDFVNPVEIIFARGSYRELSLGLDDAAPLLRWYEWEAQKIGFGIVKGER
jgi:hypothetical protein